MNTPNEKDLSERRAKLDEALAQKAGQQDRKRKSSDTDSSGWGAAVKVSSEFVGGVLVGAGIGYLVDRLAGTGPWGLILFLLLGFCAGVLNVMRATGKVAEPQNRVSDDQDR